MTTFSESIPTEVDTTTMCLQGSLGLQRPDRNENALTSPSAMPANPVPTATCLSTTSVKVSPANTIIHDLGSSIVAHHHMDHQHSGAPSDGDTVWYCSNCGNGPMGTWYRACPCCGHECCQQCIVEIV